jgi:hypothetical protein
VVDSKLTALADGHLAEFTYGTEGGQSKRYHGGNTINVRDYGAKGNNSDDDWTALQNCINAVAVGGVNQFQNKAMYFPSGNYLISKALRFTDVQEIDVFGDGFQHTLIGMHPSYALNGNTVFPNRSVSCLLEFDGFHNSKIRDMNLYWSGNGSMGDYNTACIYAYGGNHRSDTVDLDNIYFTGASYGVLIGGGPLVSEWCYRRSKFLYNGQAGVIIFGQNSVNHTFYGCSFARNGNHPLLTTCTGSITGTVLNVTAFTTAANNPPLGTGLMIFDASGTVKGNCFILETNAENPSRTGTGGVGTYTVTQSHSATGARTINAINLNMGGIVNVSGAATIISGCDMTEEMCDIRDTGANNIVVSGIRTESPNFAVVGSGTAATFNGDFAAVNLNSDVIATTNGPLLTVTSLSPVLGNTGPGYCFPGAYIFGTDGTTSLPVSVSPGATKVLYQLSGSENTTGVFLMNQSPAGNLTTFTCHVRPVFLDLQGGCCASLSECGATGGVILGNNNSQVRVRNNRFGPGTGTITGDLFNGFFGRILEYDVSYIIGVDNETVANLPAPHSRWKGCRMYVIDSSVTTFGSIVVGGGPNTVPVWCDGTNWKVG